VAQGDYLLKIDGIEGESLVGGFENQIDVLSMSMSESQSGTFAKGSGGGAGKVNVQDFHFTMPVSKASPKLFNACCTGQHIKKAVLTCRKVAGDSSLAYLTVTFSDLLISSFQTGGQAHADVVPVDQISFNFKKWEKEYKKQNQDGSSGGSTKIGFDLGSLKKV
jgi:type VI secretion system secreted protein Hcp